MSVEFLVSGKKVKVFRSVKVRVCPDTGVAL
jgi:hypothetical protein